MKIVIENAKLTLIKRTKKIVIKFLRSLTVLLVLIALLLAIPAVQTKLGRVATNYLNKDFNTNIVVNKVDLSILGRIKLKEIDIKDHHLDSMINIESLSTSIFSYRNILNNKFEFGDITLEGINFIMKTYEGENEDAFNIFVSRFDEEKPDTIPSNFLMTAERVILKDAFLTIIDENRPDDPDVFFDNIYGDVDHLLIDGPNFSGDIRDFEFIENHQIQVEDLDSDFSYTRQRMKLANTSLRTETSIVEADVTFFRDGSFKDFNNKVQFEAKVKEAHVSLIDLNKFYGKFGNNDILHFSSNLSGTLNNFYAEDLQLQSDMDLIIDGDFEVVNAFENENGFSLNAKLRELISDHKQLKGLLPSILEKSLPTEFKTLGRFELSGNAFVTPELIDAQLQLNSDIGSAITDLELSNIGHIDNASYKGEVKIIDFKLGEYLKDSLIGKLSVDAYIDGTGFRSDNLNIAVDGMVHKHQYKGYTYRNIRLVGQFGNKKFNGQLFANDENLKLDFIGLADLASNPYNFDFEAIIDYADFNKLNLFKHDSISILKGDIDIALRGNTLEDLEGSIHFTQASYTNQNDLYFFKDFDLISSFDGNVRTVSFNSPDIMNGEIKGEFLFRELGKLAQNTIGSIYTNYDSNSIREGQYLDFDFKIYDKVIEILFPEVKLDPNTFIEGSMNGDTDELKISMRSPGVSIDDVHIDSIRLQIDNQNPLFNTQFTIDEITAKSYRLSDIGLVNVTLNDTLYFRTQFKGGFENTETFDLGFYHTIDENDNSIVGINNSKVIYKNQTWKINPNENKKNKVVFAEDLSSFEVKEFDVQSGRQKIKMFGSSFGAEEKNLNIEFDNVNLAGITPDIEDWHFAGLINGGLSYNESQGDVLPVANIFIEDFFVNESYQGNLNVDVQGQNSLRRFDVDVSIIDGETTNLLANGVVDFTSEEPNIGMNIDFDRLKLDILSPLGDENFTNMRGYVYGEASLVGNLNNPAMRGELFLDQAGVALPYLNVDYDFEGTTVVNLHEQTFEIVDLSLRDIHSNTTGTLDGTISHSYFTDWSLDLNLNTNNLLVLNTDQSEDELYYGQGYIDGSANIRGLTDNLTINVIGKTNPGTRFVIPLSDLKTVENTKLVRFVSDKNRKTEENAFEIPEEMLFDRIKGLSINFDLEVTKDAVIEMILDEATNSSLKGSGTGDLRIEIDTNGKFNMFGDFTVDNGRYDFTLAGVANKRFEAVKGGTISWNGNPYTADVNIETIYRVYANPKTILESVYTNRDIPVDLVTRFTGELYDSQKEFDVIVPDVDSEVKSELDFKISQNEDMIKHWGTLLIFGNFYNDESTLFENSKGVGEETVYQLLSGAITGLISKGNDNFKMSFDYRSATDLSAIEDINTNDQFDVSVKTKINDRILIDGTVGVPVGSENKNATVVGEATVEFLLNDEGTLRSTVFNRQNEIQYTEEEEGYTQGVGLSYTFDFDNGKELLERLGLRKKEKEKDSAQQKGIDTIQKTNRPKTVTFKSSN
ncbi:translocation/assembly module TamB domain-containing protein [Urechidicola sp. KH5]